MDQFTTFIAALDQTLTQRQMTGPTVVDLPVTFSWQQHHLQVTLTTLQTSFNEGAHDFDVVDILDRIQDLANVELADVPPAQWPPAKSRSLTITPHKVVRVIPVMVTTN